MIRKLRFWNVKISPTQGWIKSLLLAVLCMLLFWGLVIWGVVYLASTESDADLKSRVVSIKSNLSIPLYFWVPGTRYGSGFVINADKGLVLTTRRVVREGVHQSIELTFSHKKVLPAKLVYYDLRHNISILKYDPSKLELRMPPLPDGIQTKDVDLDELLQIYHASWSKGIRVFEQSTISKNEFTSVSRFLRQTNHMMIHAAGRRVNTGAPVFTDSQKWAGMVTYEDDEEGKLYVLPYDVLRRFARFDVDAPPSRGELFMDTSRISLKGVKRYLGLKDTSYTQEQLLEVDTASEKSCLKVGDVLLEVRDSEPSGSWKKIHLSNAFELERIVDDNVGKDITLKVLRKEHIQDISCMPQDLEKQKTTSFLRWMGSTLYMTPDYQRMAYDMPEKFNVILSQALSGSPWGAVGSFDKLFIHKIQGRSFKNIEALAQLTQSIQTDQGMNVLGRDINESALKDMIFYLNADVERFETVSYDWSHDTHVWVKHE